MLLGRRTSTTKDKKAKGSITITTSELTDKYLNERMRLSYYKSATIDHNYIEPHGPKKASKPAVTTNGLTASTNTCTETIPFSYIGQGYEFVVLQSSQLSDGPSPADEKARQRRYAKRVKRKAKQKQREAMLKQQTEVNNGLEATTCSSTMVTANTVDIKSNNKYLPKSDDLELEFDNNPELNDLEEKPAAGKAMAAPVSLKYLVEKQEDEESEHGPGSDGGETEKRGLDEYLDGALSSDYDSEDASDSDDAIRFARSGSSRDGNNSDDSVDVRKANYR